MKRILSLLSVFMMCCVMWAGSQTLPTLSTSSKVHYYTIKNLRTSKYLYWNNNSDNIRQNASRNFDCFFYFTAGDQTATTDGVTSVKIHNLSTSTLLAGFNSWTYAGANWYVKAASGGDYTGIAFSTSEGFSACWNSYDSESKIGSWGIDGGSIFEIEEVTESDIVEITSNQLKAVSDSYSSSIGQLFGCTQASYDALVNSYEKYKSQTTISTDDINAMKAAKNTFLTSTPASTDVADGTIAILGNYLHTNDYVIPIGNNVGRGTTKDSYKYEWTLKKQANGNYLLYNAYADKYIGSIPTTGGHNGNGDDVALSLVDNNAAQEYTIGAGIQLGYATFKSTQTGLAENRAYLHMGAPGIVRWEGGVDASSFIITNVSSEEAAWDAAITSKANKAKSAVGTAIGYYNSAITGYADAFSNATENATKARAYQQLESALVTERITPDPNKYYTINNATNTNIYLGEKYDEAGYFENTNAVYAQSLAANTVPSLWQFEPCTASGKTDLYYVKAANSGKYFSSVYWQTNNDRYLSLVDKSDANCGAYDIFYKEDVNKENAVTFVYYRNDARSDRGTARIENDQTQGKLHSWNAAVTGNNFFINEVTEIPVTISSAGVATLNLPFAVTIPKGVKAYTGTKNGSEITLSEITTGTIPAQTPVILEGEGKVYQFPIAYGNTETNDAQGLKGTLAPVTIADDATAYVLKNGGQGIGMYKIDSTSDRTIGANKAYAGSATVDTNAPQMLSFNFGNVTGINTIQGQKNESNTYYDLNGHRVLYPTHGIYVKGNGQKVYIK